MLMRRPTAAETARFQAGGFSNLT